MRIEEVKNIAVIGAGNMGHQISTLCALHGYSTKCTDIDANTLKKAQEFVDDYLPTRVHKGKLSEDQAEQARERLTFTQDFHEAVKDADFVIEAAVEEVEVKSKIFADLDRRTPSHAILATNSSYIVSSRVADATNRQDKVVNLHFFNPALVMRLVEVVQGPHVSEETTEVCFRFCESVNKVPVHLKKEVKGFLLNRIISAIRNEALWMYEMGVAGLEDIDKACIYGAGHPMGPFRLMDLTGIDLVYIMALEEFRETGDRSYLPSPSVVERYVKGEYGEKTGKGWYDYSGK